MSTRTENNWVEENPTYPEAIRVHVVSSDVHLAPVKDVARKRIRTALYQFIAGDLTNNGPAMMLPHAPNRIRAKIWATGSSGGEFIIASTNGDAKLGIGVNIDNSFNEFILELLGNDEFWVMAGAGLNAAGRLNIVAEYEEDKFTS